MEENEEEVDYEDYSLDDTIDAISYTLKTQEPVQAEWCLLMVDVYTGTLTEVTVRQTKTKHLTAY